MSDAASYWTGLVAGESLDEVGHPDMGRSFNEWAYKLRYRAIVKSVAAVRPWSTVTRLYEGAIGTGYYLSRWKSLGVDHVAGVDLSPRAVASAQRRFPDDDLTVGSLDALDKDPGWSYRKGRYQVVTAIDVLYHILDDASAGRAVQLLADLVAPGGVLVVTEKHDGLLARERVSEFVARRPESWYVDRAREAGLTLADTRPMFWCMDPPVAHGTDSVSRVLARGCWLAMRVLVKPWPRNSRPQRVLGGLAGAVGYAIDRLVLWRATNTPNLRVLTFRRQA